ncbi:hypothetical protein AB0F88_01385 [Streptosporangium sp. NPDC023963]|uniref:hypothetical protein n=1 Tax=Streptosporangium sp. NPDC023963 TaxID=3155608 RepID=UPI0034281D1A
MSSLIESSGGQEGDGAYRVAAVGAVLSNLINNLPACTVVEQAIHPGDRNLLFALFIGATAGSVITLYYIRRS